LVEELVDELGAIELELLSSPGLGLKRTPEADAARAATSELALAIGELLHADAVTTKVAAAARARATAILAWVLVSEAHDPAANTQQPGRSTIEMRQAEIERRARALRQRALVRWKSAVRDRRR